MISRPLLAKIHIAKAQLRLADEAYRDILRAQCGVASAKDLTVVQADRLLAYFATLGFVPSKPFVARGRARHNPLALPSPGQQALIQQLFTQLGWTEPARRAAFARTLCGGHPWPQSRGDANKLIEALKSMKARGYTGRPSQEGPA